MITGGVDEAGRGSIIGPLVVAGVSFRQQSIPRLVELGVRDSKQLTPAQRESLFPKIRKEAFATCIVKLAPSEIDDVVLHGTKLRKLNYLEAMAMARIIRGLSAQLTYIDAADVKAERFGNLIKSMLPDAKMMVISRHKADATYPSVSAASIIAKVVRDKEISKLERSFGDIGSGYPSDQVTINYLRRWLDKHHTKPPFARHSWRTWERIYTLTLDGSF